MQDREKDKALESAWKSPIGKLESEKIASRKAHFVRQLLSGYECAKEITALTNRQREILDLFAYTNGALLELIK